MGLGESGCRRATCCDYAVGIADGRSEYPVSRRMRIAGRENVKRTNPEAESHEF